MGAYVRVEVETILTGPFCNVLSNVFYNGNALRNPIGGFDDGVICVFKKGNQSFRERFGSVESEEEW